MDILLAAAESLHRAETDKVHMRSGKIQKVHVKRKRGIFRCDKCTSVFGLRHNLLRHERTIHEGRRPFKCNVAGCSASFVQRFDLQTHAASVHHKRKDFVCSVCSRAFSQRSNLLTHLRSSHASVISDPEAEADRVVSTPNGPPANQRLLQRCRVESKPQSASTSVSTEPVVTPLLPISAPANDLQVPRHTVSSLNLSDAALPIKTHNPSPVVGSTPSTVSASVPASTSSSTPLHRIE